MKVLFVNHTTKFYDEVEMSTEQRKKLMAFQVQCAIKDGHSFSVYTDKSTGENHVTYEATNYISRLERQHGYWGIRAKTMDALETIGNAIVKIIFK